MIASDPLSPLSWMALGATQWFVGRAEQTIPALQRGLDLDQRNFISHWCIGYAYALLGRLGDAWRHANVLHEMGPDVPYTRQLLIYSRATWTGWRDSRGKRRRWRP